MFPILEGPLRSLSAVFPNQGWYLTRLPSHLFGRWTHSSSPPSFAAPTDKIITRNDVNPATNISLALSESFPAFKNVLLHKAPIKSVIIQVSHAPIPTAVKATNKLLPCWRNALRALDQSEREKWQVLDQWDSEEGRGRRRSRIQLICANRIKK